MEAALADPELYTAAARPPLTALLARQATLARRIEAAEADWLAAQAQFDAVAGAADA